jgi:competence protein ComEA
MLRRWGSIVIVAAIVCGIAAAGPADANKRPPANPLDLNSATVEQLQQLPGIGPATAKAIVRFREKSGPFRRVEDLLAVRGITKKRLDKLRPYLTVAPSSSKTAP